MEISFTYALSFFSCVRKSIILSGGCSKDYARVLTSPRHRPKWTHCDGQRVFIELSAETSAKMDDYFAAIGARFSPII